MKERIRTTKKSEQGGVYSPAMLAEGKTLYISGQVAYDANGDLVGKGDIEAQARLVFQNLKDLLEVAGMDFSNVVKTNYYITDVKLWPKVSAMRKDYFVDPYPASTMVEVNGLVNPDLLLEVELVAVSN